MMISLRQLRNGKWSVIGTDEFGMITIFGTYNNRAAACCMMAALTCEDDEEAKRV